MLDLPPGNIIPVDEVEALRHAVADLFQVADTTLDKPKAGYVRFRGRFLQDPADCFAQLRQRFESIGYTPQIRQEDDRIALIGMPVVFEADTSNWIINAVLFLATIATTLYVGAAYELESAVTLDQIWRGIPFSLSLMLILGAHELGHYFAARHHKVPVTLPYFIPVPGMVSFIGTMGAFIRLKGPVNNRRALLDVGAAGPLAGMVFAIPILLYGLAHSEIGPPPAGGYLLEGNSILYALSKLLVFGQMLPANGIDVSLNQIAWAGWVGLLVTGLNLIPLGQLDGGHVTYVLLGDKARQLFWPIIAGLMALTLFTDASMWGLWIVLLFFFGRSYAEPLDNVTPLDSRRRLVAILTLVIFFFVFIPVPFRIILP